MKADLKTYPQGPNEALDYEVLVVGDTICSATASITPNTATLSPVFVSVNALSARVRVSGIGSGTYRLSMHIVGTSGQVWDEPDTSVLITGV